MMAVVEVEFIQNCARERPDWRPPPFGKVNNPVCGNAVVPADESSMLASVDMAEE